MGARFAALRILSLLLVVGWGVPAAAQGFDDFVFDVIPYEVVGAFGENNERDVNAESCDLVLGCFDQQGRLCGGDPDDPNNPDNPNGPDQPCDLQTVPAGRCTTGNSNESVWPSKSGECAGTLGYFERGAAVTGDTREVSVGGVACLTNDYRAALAVFSKDPNRDSTQVDALEGVNGPSSMCPDNGTCAHMRCKVTPALTGVVPCTSNADCTARADDECILVNDNAGNCQAFDPEPSFCVDNPEVSCGVDDDCPKFCVNGPFDGDPCITSLTECGASDDFCVGGTNNNQICLNNGQCPGGSCTTPTCSTSDTCSIEGNDFEPAVCGGTQARCSDGDPEREVGGIGTSLCTDIVLISGQVDSQQNCGRNAGASALSSPRNAIENPFFLFTPQRDPGTGFQGSGVIRRVRGTSAISMQRAADADAKSMGIRALNSLGQTFWQDAAFSADDVNGALDTIIIGTRCSPPDPWESQEAVRGNCSAPNQATFCVSDDDCPGTCVNLFFCHELEDPNNRALGPAQDSVGFIWQRDIVWGPEGSGVNNEPVPAGLSDIWSTSATDPTCPPVCGTEYDQTTLESETLTNAGIMDRGSGIQLGLDSLQGRLAGAGDMLSVDASTSVAFVNIGDIRCQLGGQDPNDLVNVGTCTASRVPCDPDNPIACAPVETCQACGGRLIRAGDPLVASKGLNRQALPIGYDDLGIDALKLVERKRLGVLNGRPTTVNVEIFVVATTGIAAVQFVDQPPCNPSGDRCVLGQAPGSQPGAVGIGSGGSFPAGMPFAHGGENRSGGSVSWAAESPPGEGFPEYVRPGSFGVGLDGIPGCMGNNSPRNNAAASCKKRLERGSEVGQDNPNVTKAKWGFCTDPSPPAGWEPEPPPACQTGTAFFSCLTPYGFDTSCLVDANSLGFNTGADDLEILQPIVDEGLGPRVGGGVTESPGVPSRATGSPIANPSDPAPSLRVVAALTLRDLDVIVGNVDNTDVVVKTDVTVCPINVETGSFECASGGNPGPCDGHGGDTDGDGWCDDEDNCTFVQNAGQEDCCTPGSSSTSNPDGIGNACQCGDVTGDGAANSFDATMIKRQALGLSAPLFNAPDNCDVTGDGNCNSFDATMVTRKALGLSAPLFGNNCPNFTGEPGEF